ncbi:MAG: oligosaccharide flippase family protein [Lewinellaceae bacterium]|nr:oligosaccharide flippase family protein [Lewinellaceae bacterium]
MKKEFFINITFLLAVNLLIKPFYLFGIDRTVQNTVPDGDYGLYFALFNFTFLFQIFTDFGIQNYNNRNISQHHQLLDKYFPNLLVLKGLLSLLYFLLVLLTGWLAGYERIYLPLLLVIATNQVLLSLILFLRSNISGLGFYRLDSLISVTDRLLLILICGILLWSPPFKGQFRIEWFAWAQTAALSITALLAFSIVRKRLKTLRFRFHLPFLLLLLRRSAPYALSVLLMTIYNRIDGVMIERMLPDGRLEADIYASAYRLFEAGNMVGFLFASLLLPIFSRMLKQQEEVGSLVRFSFQMIAVGALTALIGVGFYRTEVMVALYDSGSAYSGRVLLYLVASFFAVYGTYIYGTLLVANGNLRQLNYIFASSLGLNIMLNLLLIPAMKAEGAALATCVTQFTVFLAEVALARWKLRLSFAGGMIARLVGFALLLLGGASLIQAYLPWPWPWRFLFSLALGGFLSLALRLIDLRGLLKLRQERFG